MSKGAIKERQRGNWRANKDKGRKAKTRTKKRDLGLSRELDSTKAEERPRPWPSTQLGQWSRSISSWSWRWRRFLSLSLINLNLGSTLANGWGLNSASAEEPTLSSISTEKLWTFSSNLASVATTSNNHARNHSTLMDLKGLDCSSR